MPTPTISLIDVLQHVLDIIGYANDKDTLIAKFNELCYEQTLLVAIQILPKDQQEKLKKEIKNKTHEEINIILLKHLDIQTIEDLLQRNSVKIFQDYITTITVAITDEQRKELANYLLTISGTSFQ